MNANSKKHNPEVRKRLGRGSILVVALGLTAFGAASAPSVAAPDLTIWDIELIPPDPAPNVDFTVRVWVANLGDIASGLFDLDLDSQKACPTLTCECFERRKYCYSFPASYVDYVDFEGIRYVPGNHSLCVRVDACDYVAESNDANNFLCQSVTIRSAIPDLIVESIAPVNPAIIAGQPTQILVTLRNQGDAMSGASTLLVDPDRNSVPGIACLATLSVSVPALDPNEPWSCFIPWTYATGGAHTFWARVDGCQQVAESNETNNIKYSTFHVSAPDLVVESITNTGGYVRVGGRRTIVARIRNNSTSLVSGPCQALVFLNRATEPYEPCVADRMISVASLPPGQSTEISFEVSYSAPSDPKLWVWIDGCRQVGETNEGNNKRTLTLQVRRGPDLIIESMATTSAPQWGQWTSVNIVVKNVGDVATPAGMNIIVNAVFDSASFPNSICTTYDARNPNTHGPLGVGARTTVLITGVGYALPGLHNFWAKVDPCDTIWESDGTNNSRKLTIDVPALP